MGFSLIIQRRSHFPQGGVAGMLRNRWPEWLGMAGRNGPEWVAEINRNQWPECVGIRTRTDSRLETKASPTGRSPRRLPLL